METRRRVKGVLVVLVVFLAGIGSVETFAQVDPNLLAHWDFENVIGSTVYDSGPHGYDGELKGIASTVAVPGRGGVLELGGGDPNYMETADFSVGDTFTVCLWIDPNTTQDGQCFIGKHTTSGINKFVFGFYQGGYHVRIGTSTYTGGTPQEGWQHLAVVVEKLNATQSQMTLYRDGTEQLWSETFNKVMNNTPGKPWVVGMDWDSGPVATDFFIGRMDNVRLYNAAFTQTKIQQI